MNCHPILLLLAVSPAGLSGTGLADALTAVPVTAPLCRSSTYAYTAFGTHYVPKVLETVAQRYTFTGREQAGPAAAAAGAPMYYRYRALNNATGRFNNRNPWGYIHKEGSLYDYVSNTPTLYGEAFSAETRSDRPSSRSVTPRDIERIKDPDERLRAALQWYQQTKREIAAEADKEKAERQKQTAEYLKYALTWVSPEKIERAWDVYRADDLRVREFSVVWPPSRGPCIPHNERVMRVVERQASRSALLLLVSQKIGSLCVADCCAFLSDPQTKGRFATVKKEDCVKYARRVAAAYVDYVGRNAYNKPQLSCIEWTVLGIDAIFKPNIIGEKRESGLEVGHGQHWPGGLFDFGLWEHNWVNIAYCRGGKDYLTTTGKMSQDYVILDPWGRNWPAAFTRGEHEVSRSPFVIDRKWSQEETSWWQYPLHKDVVETFVKAQRTDIHEETGQKCGS